MALDRRLWKVVGGEGKGGIVVREGKDLKSSALSDRLSTDAVCAELELDKGRLKYELVTGSGPSVGWVSIRVSDKDLVVRIAQEETPLEASGLGELPHQLKPACDVASVNLTPVEPLGKFAPASSIKDAGERAKLRRNGDLYGLPLPVTPQEFESQDFGAAWLTQAFHAAGSISRENGVLRIASARNFPGGGSGPKTLFVVEYAMPDPSLDTTLFMKLPAAVGSTGSGVSSAQQRVQDMRGVFGDIWGAEIQFYRFVSPVVPFSVPKFYFGDLSRESHQACIITSAVEWPRSKAKDFGPYSVLPPCEKCEDYTLHQPHDYYFALLRRLGQLSGLSKVGKLGPEFDKITWSGYGPSDRGFPDGLTEAFVTFAQDVAPQIWPAKVRSTDFLRFLAEFSSSVSKCAAPIDAYVYSNPLYMGFGHQNGNTDNAYFYRNREGTMEAGIFDWGSAGVMAYAHQFMGSFGSCLGEMLAEYDDRLIQVFADAYHSTGAPQLDVDELILQFRLVMSAGACQMLGMVVPYLSERHPQGRPFWRTVTAYNDERIRSSFALKFGVSMLYNRVVLLSLRGDVYAESLKMWVKRMGLA